MEMLKELWAFMRTRKKYWLWPIFVMMALLGVLIVLAQGSAIAPFIRSLLRRRKNASRAKSTMRGFPPTRSATA